MTKEQKLERIRKAGYRISKVTVSDKTAFLALRWDKNYRADTVTELHRQIFGY